jgi:hypothetical protein
MVQISSVGVLPLSIWTSFFELGQQLHVSHFPRDFTPSDMARAAIAIQVVEQIQNNLLAQHHYGYMLTLCRGSGGTMAQTYHSATIVGSWEEQSGEPRLLLYRRS